MRVACAKPVRDRVPHARQQLVGLCHHLIVVVNHGGADGLYGSVDFFTRARPIGIHGQSAPESIDPLDAQAFPGSRSNTSFSDSPSPNGSSSKSFSSFTINSSASTGSSMGTRYSLTNIESSPAARLPAIV